MDIFQQQIPLWMVLAYGVFMAAVQALPRPTNGDTKMYVFMYQFLHLLSVNIVLALKPKKDSPEADKESR